MNAIQFRASSIALLRTAVGWQSAIARRLEVSPRTVRRWIAVDQVPGWAAERIHEWAGVAEPAHGLPRDEWLVGDGVLSGREYVVHLHPPRFVARVVDCDARGGPVPGEEPADIVGGVVYSMGDGAVLCEIVWIDEPDPDDVVQMLEQAGDALERVTD